MGKFYESFSISFVWSLRDLCNIHWKHLEVFNIPHFYSAIMTPLVTSCQCYLLTDQRLVLKMCSPVLIMEASLASLRHGFNPLSYAITEECRGGQTCGWSYLKGDVLNSVASKSSIWWICPLNRPGPIK